MSSETDAREWHYCDVLGGSQKGPVPAVVLCRLLEKGVGVIPQTLIWKVGMESWLPMSAVSIKLLFLFIWFVANIFIYSFSGGTFQKHCRVQLHAMVLH